MSGFALNVAMKTNELSCIRPTTGNLRARTPELPVLYASGGLLAAGRTNVTQMSSIYALTWGTVCSFFWPSGRTETYVMQMSPIYVDLGVDDIRRCQEGYG